MKNKSFNISKLDERIEILKNNRPLPGVGVRFVWNSDKSKVVMKKI